MNAPAWCIVVLFSFLISQGLHAAACDLIFPDGASNFNNSGRIEIYNGSRISNSPDNILDTRQLSDLSGGSSCDTTTCVASNAVSFDENYNTFPNSNVDINLGSQQTATVSPGAYDDLILGSQATLTMEPGVYTFRDSVTLGFNSEIIVSQPGTVFIYLRGDATISTQAVINQAGGARSVLIYARDDVFVRSDAQVNALIYARDDVDLDNGAVVNGAISARDRIRMFSGSTINYDIDLVQTGNFEPFCSASGLSSFIIQENEAGFCSVDGTIDTNHGGFTGTGFANPGFGSGVATEWSIDGDAGNYTLTWRYALAASARPGDLFINGQSFGSVSFPSTGSWSSWATTSVTLSLAAGPKTVSLVGTTSGGLANIDYLEVLGRNATTAICGVVPTLASFRIDASSSASVCAPMQISVTALDGSGAVLDSYIGTVNLSTSTSNGIWATTADAADAQGTLAAAADDSGTANYTFEAAGADAGRITLNFENTHAETLTITVSDSGGGVSTESAPITFAENAFVIAESDALVDDIIAGRRHQFSAALVGRDPTDPNYPNSDCGTLDTYSATSVKAWVSRSEADPGGAAPRLNNNVLSDSVILPNSQGSVVDTLDLNFTSGVATFSLDTTDVGHYSIELLDDISGFSDSAIRGTSNLLTVRPFGFEVDIAGNPGANSADGTVFIAAGQNFTVNVQAKGWHPDDDTDDNGVPDIYQESPETYGNNANFSGANLVSFGQETPVESLVLSADLIRPVGGVNSGLAGDVFLSTFSGGSATTSGVYVNEVGIFAIRVSPDSPYLGATVASTAKSISSSIEVGRFIPAYFSVSGEAVTAACDVGGFSYLGEPFDASFAITAYSLRNTITQNYQANFSKLNAASGSYSFGGVDGAAPTDLSTRITTNEFDVAWLAGVGAAEATLTVARDALSDGPFSAFNLGTLVEDSDGVTLMPDDLNLDLDADTVNDQRNLGGMDLFFGRLTLSSAHGPESAELGAPFYTEYWTGTTWQRNVVDDCTAISQSDIQFAGRAIDDAANRSVVIGSGSTTGSFADSALATIGFIAGDAGLRFSAPGVGNTGRFNVDVDLNSYPWLRFDWNQNGSNADDIALPSSEISFGSYRAHDRVIYWREELN